MSNNIISKKASEKILLMKTARGERFKCGIATPILDMKKGCVMSNLLTRESLTSIGLMVRSISWYSSLFKIPMKFQPATTPKVSASPFQIHVSLHSGVSRLLTRSNMRRCNSANLLFQLLLASSISTPHPCFVHILPPTLRIQTIERETGSRFIQASLITTSSITASHRSFRNFFLSPLG